MYSALVSLCPNADCFLIERLFGEGLSILFVRMQSPSPPIHGWVTALVASTSAAHAGQKSWKG